MSDLLILGLSPAHKLPAVAHNQYTTETTNFFIPGSSSPGPPWRSRTNAALTFGTIYLYCTFQKELSLIALS